MGVVGEVVDASPGSGLDSLLVGLPVFVCPIQADDEVDDGFGEELVQVELFQNVHQVVQKDDAHGFRSVGLGLWVHEVAFDDHHGHSVFAELLQNLEQGVGVLAFHQGVVFG